MRDPSPLVDKREKAPSLPLLESKTMSPGAFFPSLSPSPLPVVGKCQKLGNINLLKRSAPSLGE
jgi:hypothetical protein